MKNTHVGKHPLHPLREQSMRPTCSCSWGVYCWCTCPVFAGQGHGFTAQATRCNAPAPARAGSGAWLPFPSVLHSSCVRRWGTAWLPCPSMLPSSAHADGAAWLHVSCVDGSAWHPRSGMLPSLCARRWHCMASCFWATPPASLWMPWRHASSSCPGTLHLRLEL